MSQTFEPQILNHPLIQHKISLMRKKETGSKDFRELASEVATLMCYEATRDLPLKEVTVETPHLPLQDQNDRRTEACHRSHSAGGPWHGGWHADPDPCRQGGPHRPVPG